MLPTGGYSKGLLVVALVGLLLQILSLSFKASFVLDPSSFSTSSCVTDKDNQPPLLQPRPLPTFNGSGGVIIFLHVAKNGGTTIRGFLESHRHVLLKKRAQWGILMPMMKQWTEGKRGPQFKGKDLVVEIHDGIDAPPLPEMAAALQNLRARAARNNVPFFVLTTLREPLPYVVSFYNWQHAGPGNGSGKYESGKAGSESDLVRVTLPNLQCMFFARGELATKKAYKFLSDNLTKEECRDTYNLLTTTVDWIGTLENLETETLPILAHMLNSRKNDKNDNNKNSVSANAMLKRFQGKKLNPERPGEKIRLDQLSSETLAHMRDITQSDLELYEKAQRDYHTEMWTNCDTCLQHSKKKRR